ncbi:Sec-independent protein translocase protein TatB [Enhygromyxa salina]|uniref:Sec-independent protein translocase protein TatB n=2 Tax=Enhygromyxa salina TaxID=215803 RepID=A0A2S9XJ54_9BACT|nr:Sec-independent protein translocase protein TatB [Enhygromyxa salina]
MMEIGLIIALAVMLFPPTELPKLVRSIARIYGQVRKTAEDFRNTVLEDEDLREPIDQIKGAYNDARWEVRDAERKARQQLAKAQMDMRMATARRIQAEREAEAKQAEAAEDAAEGSAEDAAEGAEASEPGGASDNAEPPASGSASPATPVRIASDSGSNSGPNSGSNARPDAASNASGSGSEPHDNLAPGGAVAGADPRRIAPRPPGAYTAPTSTPDAAAGDESDDNGEAREGVA